MPRTQVGMLLRSGLDPYQHAARPSLHRALLEALWLPIGALLAVRTSSPLARPPRLRRPGRRSVRLPALVLFALLELAGAAQGSERARRRRGVIGGGDRMALKAG